MTLPLPISNFHFLKMLEILKLKFETMTEDQPIGYIVECDLDYPENLHEAHSSMPLAPRTFNIDQDMLSPYAKRCRKIISGREKYKSQKLAAPFGPRKRYVVRKNHLFS